MRDSMAKHRCRTAIMETAFHIFMKPRSFLLSFLFFFVGYILVHTLNKKGRTTCTEGLFIFIHICTFLPYACT